MKKLFLICLTLIISLLVVSCKKKPQPQKEKNPYLEEYEKQDQDELINDYEYSSPNFSEVNNISNQGLKKEALYFPKKVKKIKAQALQSSKVKRIIFSANIEVIGQYCILNSPSLEQVVFLNKFTTQGPIGFNLEKLSEVVFYDVNIKKTDSALFINTPKLEKFNIINSNVEFSNNQLLIKDGTNYLLAYIASAFDYKFNDKITHILNLIGFLKEALVKELVLPKNIKFVGQNFINKAPNLNKITISLTNLEHFSSLAIQGAPLKEIIKDGEAKDYDVINNTLVKKDEAILLSSSSNLKDTTIFKIGSYASNKNSEFTMATLENVLSASTTEIGDYAFYGASLKGELDFSIFTSLSKVGKNIFNAINFDDLTLKNYTPKDNWDKDWDKR